jgi:hypothetical protein
LTFRLTVGLLLVALLLGVAVCLLWPSSGKTPDDTPPPTRPSATDDTSPACTAPLRPELAPEGKTEPTLVVFKAGEDPRTGLIIPIIAVPLNLQGMRKPMDQPIGSPIRTHVRGFDDFVYVIGE